MTDFYRERYVKHPRKKHICGICGKPIDGYHLYISAYNDGFAVMRQHIDCNIEVFNMCGACAYSNDCQGDIVECWREMKREQERCEEK